jgi:uncharacterized ion transporter superfamily protein YfcC
VLVLVTLLVWIAAFLIPSGTYDRDEAGVPAPGSYQRVDSPQDLGERTGDLFLAPVNGLYGLQDPETGFVRPFGLGTLYGHRLRGADPITHETVDNDFWWNLGWWFPEQTALFLVATVVVGFVAGFSENDITGNIIRGFGDFIGAAVAVVLARGVTVILNNTQTIDTS